MWVWNGRDVPIPNPDADARPCGRWAQTGPTEPPHRKTPGCGGWETATTAEHSAQAHCAALTTRLDVDALDDALVESSWLLSRLGLLSIGLLSIGPSSITRSSAGGAGVSITGNPHLHGSARCGPRRGSTPDSSSRLVSRYFRLTRGTLSLLHVGMERARCPDSQPRRGCETVWPLGPNWAHGTPTARRASADLGGTPWSARPHDREATEDRCS
jgi:hypothetical protein